MQLASVLAVAGGIATMTAGLSRLAGDRGSDPLAEIADDYVDYDPLPNRPLIEKLLTPARANLGRLGRKFTPSSGLAKMRRHAVLAGLGAGGMESILAVRAVGTAVGAALITLVCIAAEQGAAKSILFALMGGGLGFLLPGAWVARTGRKRQQQIRRDLPETIDLMAIAVQAGMGLEAALELASESLPGPLGDELHRLLQEIQLGSSRREALHLLRERTDVSELSSFALALIQADAIGSPIAEVLQSNSARMRLIRRQVAREKAAKLPVKLLIPMMLFIFPPLFVVIVGPAAFNIVESLKMP
ncbi:MAG TPA: type II secretion system F family protein [Actinomycetota bacterium]|nr:type II secretion system F family protein [Actinomycetota bacterium]